MKVQNRITKFKLLNFFIYVVLPYTLYDGEIKLLYRVTWVVVKFFCV